MRCAVDRVGGVALGGERGRESGRGGRAAHPHGLRGQVRLQGLHAGDVADPGAHRPHVLAGAHPGHVNHDHGASSCGSVAAHRAARRCPCAVRALTAHSGDPCTTSLCRPRDPAQNRPPSARRTRSREGGAWRSASSGRSRWSSRSTPGRCPEPGSGSCWRCWPSPPAAWSPCRLWSTHCGARTLPANPGNALQVRVSKLRRALTAAGLADTLASPARPGTCSTSIRRRVDALRFADLVAAARTAAGPDPETAARRYREALALWRGTPLAEFAGTRWAGPEAARLTELQLAARDELIDLELAAGRHTEMLDRARGPHRRPSAARAAARPADARALPCRAAGRRARRLPAGPGRARRRARPRPGRGAARPAGGDPAAAPGPGGPGTGSTSRAPETPARKPVRHRLPARLTSFLGRDVDLRRVGELLRDRAAGHRHRSRRGRQDQPGAGGRPRRRATASATASPSSGWPASSDPDQVPAAALAALEIRDVATATAEDQLLGHLRDRAVLLVLDNCEHLADACALLAEQLLESCPDVQRAGHQPRAAGRPRRGPVRDRPAAGPAGRTAAAARPDRQRRRPALPRPGPRRTARLRRPRRGGRRRPSPTSAGTSTGCRWRSSWPPPASRRCRSTSSPDGWATASPCSPPAPAPPRPGSARCEPPSTGATSSSPTPSGCCCGGCRSSAAAGRWTAVQAVAGGEPLDPRGRRGPARPPGRPVAGRRRPRRPARAYHLLETIREYAAERLAESGEVERMARAHVGYLTDLAERAETELRGDGQARWLPRLALERDDIDAALAWCTAHADHRAGRRAAAGRLRSAGTGTSPPIPTAAAGSPPCSTAAPGGSPAARARALQALAVAARPGACIVHPDPDCAAAAEQSRRAVRRTRRRVPRRAVGHPARGRGHRRSGDRPLPSRSSTEAEREFARDGDAWCAALADFVRLELHAGIGDLDAATAVGHRALLAFRALGDQWGVSAIQFHLGMALHARRPAGRGAGHVRGRACQRARRRPGQHRPVRPRRRRPRDPAARRRRPGRAAVRRVPRGRPPTRRRGQPAGRGRRGAAGPPARRPGRRPGAPHLRAASCWPG